MTDKELRKLSRRELLEILVELAEENENLRTELEKTNAKLESRRIAVSSCGTLAEAALKLNGFFQSVDAAAKQYLENIEHRCEQAKLRCEQIEAKAEKEAESIIAEAEKQGQKIRADADIYRNNILNQDVIRTALSPERAENEIK